MSKKSPPIKIADLSLWKRTNFEFGRVIKIYARKREGGQENGKEEADRVCVCLLFYKMVTFKCVPVSPWVIFAACPLAC